MLNYVFSFLTSSSNIPYNHPPHYIIDVKYVVILYYVINVSLVVIL
jgi:hypothetical protein